MSPLGPISVFPQLQPPPLQFPLPRLALNYYLNEPFVQPPQQEHLLRFMSVSLGHGQHRRRHGHRHGDLQRSLSSAARNMTLLNESGNSGFMGKVPKTLLHGIRNYISPEVEERGGASVAEEEELSGDMRQEKERLESSDVQNDAEETDGEIDVDDSMSTVTMTTASQSPSPSSSHSVRSPTPPDSNSLEPGSRESNFRLRNYSSEDSQSLKSVKSLNSTPSAYNPLSSLSEALINNSFQQEQQRHHQASLLFSIANILRPDFGLGRLPLPNTGTIPTPAPPINFYHFSKTHQTIHHHQRPTTKRKASFPDLSTPNRHTSEQNHHKRLKPDPVIPIDLSRPDPRSKVTNRKSANHHRITPSNKPQQWSPPFPQGPPPGKPKSHDEEKRGSDKVTSSVTSAELGDKSSGDGTGQGQEAKNAAQNGEPNWPAWVYCTRYSDRPSSGPRARRSRKPKEKEVDEKRPRTAFTADQLERLKKEFLANNYLNEKRRQDLANDLQLHENQIKIWFQNKRAKAKKSKGQPGELAVQLRAQGLYNHSTIQSRGCGDDDDDDSD